MAEGDRIYFEGRAEQELEMAQASGNPQAVRAHYLLAGCYLDLVYGGDEPSPDNDG